MTRIALGLSGGVDSAVSAHLLQEAGFEVVAIYMQLIADGSNCQEEYDARSLAEQLGLEYHVIDGRKLFEKKVIQPFIKAYQQGFTPNPCVVCNGRIKFDFLWQEAKALGCELLATGHYARMTQDSKGRPRLKRALDAQKDQSYFMLRIPRELLPFLRFPLGDFNKEFVRSLALELDLPVARKKDSQEVCFIPKDDYAAFLESRHLKSSLGDFVDSDGSPLGRHQGIHHYTIGQRRGLGLALGYPAYVIDIDPDSARVAVGPDHALWKESLVADQCIFHVPIESGQKGHALAKIRSRGEPQAVSWRYDGEQLHVAFDEPVRAISPGQALVLYEDNMLLGGGRILNT